MHNKSQLTSDSKKQLTLNVLVHRGVLCQFPFRWIYYNGSNKSTGKEIGKNHLCVVYQYCIECQFFWIRLYYRLQIHLSDSYQTWWILDVYLITAWRLPDTHDNWGLTIMVCGSKFLTRGNYCPIHLFGYDENSWIISTLMTSV